jgi:hypothetical protein
MSNKKTKIALAETGQFSSLILDYINGNNSLRNFYSYEPKIEAFQKAITDKQQESINRELLATLTY